MRSVLLWVMDRQGIVTDRNRKYRPRIDRLEMSRFAGLSPRYWSPRSVFWLVLLMAYDRSPCIVPPVSGKVASARSETANTAAQSIKTAAAMISAGR
jgi:hypothetical protein